MSLLPSVQRSEETLTHFRCTSVQCQQWWSIADFDTPPGRLDKPYIVCPRCGLWHRLGEVIQGALAA